MGLKSLGKKAEECQGRRVIESGDRLHTFSPKTGGQTEFYELVMESTRSGKFPRAVDLIGGIGCISGDTLINGVPAKELQNSPNTVETLIGELTSSPVYLKGQANLYRVTTRRGKRIVVTGMHRFLTQKGFYPLQSLRCGDFVAIRDTENDCHDWGKPKGYQSRYCEDFHHDDAIPHPFSVFVLDRLQQFFLHHNDIPDWNDCFPRATVSFSQDFLSRTSFFELLSEPTDDELLRRQHHKQQRVLDKFRQLDIVQQLHPLGCRVSCASLSQVFQQELHAYEFDSLSKQEKRQNVLLLYDNFATQHNATKQPQCLTLFSQPYLNVNGGNHFNYSDIWDKIEAIECTGFGDFYDLHVPIANHYLANDFWNHNSGKSYMGAWYACIRAKQDPQSRGLISANEFNQLRTSTIVALAEFCDRFGVPLSPVGYTPDETARMITARQFCTIYDAPVLVLSANKFGGSTTKAKQGARGTQLRYAWLDEWAYADKSAWETLNGRLGRGDGSIPGQAVITSSINRNHPFNWVYDTFSDPDRSPELQRLYKAIRCLTADNDSLDPEYLQSLEASYTPELAALELRGEYVSATEGLIFRYFKRTQHTDGGIGYSMYRPLHISFDFNHSPACAIAAQSDDTNLFVLREWYLLNSDTFELAAAVANWAKSLPGTITPYGTPANPVFVYGDASGSARSANSKTTNWAIVTAELQGLRWTQRWGSSNPSVVDSLHSCNSLLFQNRVYVHPSCKELIKDFESLKWDSKDGIDKADIARSHLCDTFRYLAHSLMPLPDARRQWRDNGVITWS